MNNLIVAAPAGITLPADTLMTDPLLQPLANNGGRRLTQALDEASPAIDHSNNIASLLYGRRR